MIFACLLYLTIPTYFFIHFWCGISKWEEIFLQIGTFRCKKWSLTIKLWNFVIVLYLQIKIYNKIYIFLKIFIV